MAAMCCLTVGGAAWRCKDFDICGNRDRFDIFEVLVAGTLSPGQELLDCPVVGGPCVRVADRDREEFEEPLRPFGTHIRD
jgi:hypothetical protein